VSCQVAQQHVDDVVVDFSVVHITIVPIGTGLANTGGSAENVRMIRGVKFVSIPVADQERALAFYTEVLGFRLITDQPFNEKQRWLELGIPGADTRVVLFQFGDTLKPGGLLNVALWSDDVEGTARELKGRGVEFVLEPTREPYGTQSIFKDIDGNRLLLSSR
jgi:catechol 2,3-dioxygenase-like lactoylglutathione lyase family enzyme